MTFVRLSRFLLIGSMLLSTNGGAVPGLSHVVTLNQPIIQWEALSVPADVAWSSLTLLGPTGKHVTLWALRRAIGRPLVHGLQVASREGSVRSWILRTGMGFGDPMTWWNLLTRMKSHNEPFHTGMDFATFLDVHGQERGMVGQPVIAKTSGRVRWIFDDDMQQGVVVETRWYGLPIYTVYMHIKLPEGAGTPSLKIGEVVNAGQQIGLLVEPKNKKSVIAPHEHFGIGLIPRTADRARQSVTVQDLNDWAGQGRIVYVDPLELLPPSVRKMLFIEGSDANLPVESIYIVSKHDPTTQTYKRIIQRQIPGVRDIKKRNLGQVPVLGAIGSNDIVLIVEGDEWTVYSGKQVTTGEGADEAALVIHQLINTTPRPASAGGLAAAWAKRQWIDNFEGITVQEWSWLVAVQGAMVRKEITVREENGWFEFSGSQKSVDAVARHAMRHSLNMRTRRLPGRLSVYPRPKLRIALLVNLSLREVFDPLLVAFELLSSMVAAGEHSSLTAFLERARTSPLSLADVEENVRQWTAWGEIPPTRSHDLYGMIDTVLWLLRPVSLAVSTHRPLVNPSASAA